MWKIKLLWVAVIALLLITGCLRDDLSDCDEGIELNFEYTHHNYEADLFSSEVSQMTIFAFNKSGIIISSFTEQVKEDASGKFKMSLPLPTGDYILLALGGELQNYSFGEVSGSGDFRLLLLPDEEKQDESVIYASHPSDLYYCKKEVSVVSGRYLSYKMDMMKNSSSVRLQIKELTPEDMSGMRSMENQNAFDIFLTGNNTMIDIENRIPAEAPQYGFSQVVELHNTGENIYNAEYRMMRLLLENPVNLRVKDHVSGLFLLDDDLIDMILQNKAKYTTQADLDKEDDFLIEIDIDRSSSAGNLSVTVRVNGWTIVKLKPVI